MLEQAIRRYFCRQPLHALHGMWHALGTAFFIQQSNCNPFVVKVKLHKHGLGAARTAMTWQLRIPLRYPNGRLLANKAAVFVQQRLSSTSWRVMVPLYTRQRAVHVQAGAASLNLAEPPLAGASAFAA